MTKTFFLALAILSSLNASGQNILKQVQHYLDSAAQRKVDPSYIEVPTKPWRIILRSKINQVDVDYMNSFKNEAENLAWNWELCFSPPLAASVGFWAGYRGTGVSYSQSLLKNAGRYFSFSTTGARYGFNFRLRRFSTSETTFHSTFSENGKVTDEQEVSGDTDAKIWIRSVYINGYYVFNGRRYSQAAAYNQSVIQRRSAGSLLVGATWYQSSLDLSEPKNAPFVILSKDIGRIKLHQANIGIGYGYNLVPFRGLVINAMAMPTLSVYNRVKVYKYDYNYTMLEDEKQTGTDDYGKWNSQTHTWTNGATHKPMDDHGEWMKDIEGWQKEEDTDYGSMHFNVDLRAGIAYNWDNYFVGLQSQFNRFTYKKDNAKVNLFDWYARLSVGIRL